MPFARTRIGEEIDLFLWPTEKFKTTTVRLILRQPLADDPGAGALLPMVLRRGTRRLPETILVARRLDELYGAELRADVMKFGEQQLLIFHLEVVARDFVGGEDPLPAALDLLADVLCDPPLEDGALRRSFVAQERANLVRRIEGIYSDKAQYAQLRLIEAMCQGEPFAIPRLGTQAEVAALTESRLLARWQEILRRSPIAIYMVGNLSEEAAVRHAQRLLRGLAPRQPQPSAAPALHRAGAAVRRVEETEDVAQGKLALGFTTDCRSDDPAYPALVLMNGIFGGFSHSRLFAEVRERHSLAYYAYSQIEGLKGLMFVQSGIEAADRARAEELIVQQLAVLREDAFRDQELQDTLAGIESQILQSVDAPSEAIMTDFELRAAGRPTDPRERMAALRSVARAEIAEAAGRIRLDTVYFLHGEGGRGDGDPD